MVRVSYKEFDVMNPAERYSVVSGLEKTYTHKARAFLEKVLISDDNAIVRHEAAYCLGIIGDDMSLSVLRKALVDDENPLVRHEAALSLAEIGTKEDILFLDKGMNDDNHDVAISCLIAREILLIRLAQQEEVRA